MIRMNKHTTGPWKAEQNSSGHVAFDINSDPPSGPWKAVATVEANQLGAATIRPQEAQANARLIAAAPDLLAVCQQLMVTDYGANLSELRHQATLAVEKATGAP
jgi:hypothetical protein